MPALTLLLRDFHPALVLSGAGVLAMFLSDDLLLLLRFDRELISAGEYWRLISANFLHTNWPHFLLNVAGFVLVLWLFRGAIRGGALSVVFVAVLLSNTLLLWLCVPSLHYYVGFSGALHGMVFALGTVMLARQPLFTVGVLGVFVIKLWFEQLEGGATPMVQVIEAPIAVDAHLLGGVAGVVLGSAYHILYWLKTR